MRYVLAALISVLTIAVAAPAGAQVQVGDVGGAKAHFAAGTSFFRDKRYREAVDEFLSAYHFSPAPDLLYNIGVSYDALDDAGRATIYFERYLSVRPDAAERSEIEASLYRLSARVGRIVIHAPDATELLLDGVPVEISPPTPLPTTAAAHHLEARRNGVKLAALDFSLAGGLSKELTLAEPSTTAPPAPTATVTSAKPETAATTSTPAVSAATTDTQAPSNTTPRSSTLLLPGAVVLAVGAAALVAGAACSALAVDASSSVTAEASAHAVFDPSVESRGQASVLASGVLYAVGGAAVLTGALVLALSARGEKKARSTARLLPSLSPNQLGATFAVSLP